MVGAITVADADIKAYYDRDPKVFSVPDRVRASHVLLNCKEAETSPEAVKIKAKLEGIRSQVVSNKLSMADAAKQFSDCPSKTQGGDLGLFTRNQMVPEFDQQAFALDIGKFSPVFKTQFGYHFLMVTEKKPAGTVPFEEAAPRIKERLLGERRNDGIKRYVEELRKTAKIENFLPPPPPAPVAPHAPASAPVPPAPAAK